MLKHLPNLLTALRIILTPFIIVLISQEHYGRAFAVGALASTTDVLDGWLARRFLWRSRLGALLDPVADKSLIMLGYLALGMKGVLPLWLVLMVLSRDVTILLLSAVALFSTKSRDFAPSPWGKCSTLVQLSTGGLAMASVAWPSKSLQFLVSVAIWLAAAATVWSALHYGWTALVRHGSTAVPNRTDL